MTVVTLVSGGSPQQRRVGACQFQPASARPGPDAVFQASADQVASSDYPNSGMGRQAPTRYVGLSRPAGHVPKGRCDVPTLNCSGRVARVRVKGSGGNDPGSNIARRGRATAVTCSRGGRRCERPGRRRSRTRSASPRSLRRTLPGSRAPPGGPPATCAEFLDNRVLLPRSPRRATADPHHS